MATPPEKIPIQPSKAPELEQPVPSGQTPSGFDSYMQGAGNKMPQGEGLQPGGPTPMSLAQNQAPGTLNSAVSYDSLLAQAGQAQDSLGVVGQQLNNQNLKLKRSQAHLVKQKLTDATSHIRAAGSKLGLQMPETSIPPGATALGKFVAMVNGGQDQLAQVQEQLKKLSADPSSVNGPEMLMVQVKMNLAQQEIQYTSTILGKVIQSFTQLLQTQL